MHKVSLSLKAHCFEHLFIECLGWDRVCATVAIELIEVEFHFQAIAQKRGFTVFICQMHRTQLANRQLLRQLQKKLRKSYHEHIVIYYCDTPRKQVWQWATTPAGQKAILHKEHPFFSHQPPPRLLKRLHGLTISLDQEEQTTLVDVLERVRAALLPDCEFDLFAKRSWYAAQSDQLAMAMKRGEPGAFGRFVEFHIPLAKFYSRKMLRWFNIDLEDAEQTAMIGLIQAARRFDPVRGYQFSTYAHYWIRQCCQRFGLEWGLRIRVPDHIFWKCFRILHVEARLITEHGERAARMLFEEYLTQTGITASQWLIFCQARRVECFSDLEKRLRPVVSMPEAEIAAARHAQLIELRHIIDEGFRTLTERQSKIISLRYGLLGREYTLEEVAAEFGVTRERIRQIQDKAEVKFAKFLMKTGYRDEFAPQTSDELNDLSESTENDTLESIGHDTDPADTRRSGSSAREFARTL